jgi:hypothetical protein
VSPVILRNIYVKIRKDSVKNQDNLYSEICHFTKCFRSYTIFHTVNVINKSRMIFHLWKTYLYDFIKVKHIAMYFYDCVTNKFILYVLTKYLKINEMMCSAALYFTILIPQCEIKLPLKNATLFHFVTSKTMLN